MAETIRNLFLKTRALLDEYTDDGVLIPDKEVIDMQSKFVPLIDMGHKELYEIARIDTEQEEPTMLTDINDTTEVNYKADQALVYYCAARIAPFENKELVAFFEDKFEQLKRKCANKATEVLVEDVYGIVSGDDE